MGKNSKIQWTTHSANLWWGCKEVHAGCDNCYAREWAKRFNKDLWGQQQPREAKLTVFDKLRSFQDTAAKQGRQDKVFVGSMMDIFEKSKPLSNANEHYKTTGDLRRSLFTNITLGYYPNLVFLFLTKRPSNINKMIPVEWEYAPPANVWYGATVVDKKTMLQVAKHMAKVRGNKFWSIEPLLEGIRLMDVKQRNGYPDWIIVGGESGPHRRPFDLAWAEWIRKECSVLRIPYFFKQIDKVTPIPEQHLVREFPNFSKP